MLVMILLLAVIYDHNKPASNRDGSNNPDVREAQCWSRGALGPFAGARATEDEEHLGRALSTLDSLDVTGASCPVAISTVDRRLGLPPITVVTSRKRNCIRALS